MEQYAAGSIEIVIRYGQAHHWLEWVVIGAMAAVPVVKVAIKYNRLRWFYKK